MVAVTSMLAAVATLALVAVSVNAAEPFNARHLTSLDRLSEGAVDPTGRLVLFTREQYNEKTNKVTRSLWVVPVASPTALHRQQDGFSASLEQAADSVPSAYKVTEPPVGFSDTTGQWLNSTHVIFLSNRAEAPGQVWLVKAPDAVLLQTRQFGGRFEDQAFPITNMPLEVENLKFKTLSSTARAPGGVVLFSSRVYASASLSETAQIDAAPKIGNGLVYDDLYIRHWASWNDKKLSHLFVLPLPKVIYANTLLKEGDVIDTMRGSRLETPILPFGDQTSFDISPQGDSLVFSAYDPNSDNAWRANADIFQVPINWNGGRADTPVSITKENLGVDSFPLFSPDGKTVAYLSMKVPGHESDQNRIMLLNVATNTARQLVLSSVSENGRTLLDRSPDSLLFSADGRYLLFGAQEYARGKIFVADTLTGDVSQLVSENTNSLIGVLPAQDNRSLRFIFFKNSFAFPNDLFVFEGSIAAAQQSTVTRLTAVNADRFAQVDFPELPQEFVYKGERQNVYGWIQKPLGFKTGKKYPLAFVIHGGPESAFEDSFSFRWNLNVFAAAGYAVVFINPTGSTGYGQNFTDAIQANWGTLPYLDLMLGADHVLKTYSWIDSERTCALGASFGGYMINWINGHTNRFKCLVNHDGLFDLKSMYYTTEEIYFPEHEFKGTPWTNPSMYEKFSPSLFVDSMNTPTLVIHGGHDYRVPEGEGISTFTALRRRGVEARLLYFPEESHWVLNRRNSQQWYSEVVAWLDKHLK